MRLPRPVGSCGLWLVFSIGILCSGTSFAAAQPEAAMQAFHWVDFHDPKDAPTVAWVTQSLKGEKWTAIREIGVLWDSAIVVTSVRATAQAMPLSDVDTVWSVGLAERKVEPLLHGVAPDILAWTTFGGEYQQAPELGLVFRDCSNCDAGSMFFTTLYYNIKEHAWRARWMHGDQAAALWSGGAVEGVTRTQIYGLLTEGPTRQVLATWNHIDYGKTKPAEDFVFEYSVDPATGLEQTQGLSGAHAETMEQRLCRADPAQVDKTLAVLAGGQDSEICLALVEAKTGVKRLRKPVTTPPANNHGVSQPGKPHS